LKIVGWYWANIVGCVSMCLKQSTSIGETEVAKIVNPPYLSFIWVSLTFLCRNTCKWLKQNQNKTFDNRFINYEDSSLGEPYPPHRYLYTPVISTKLHKSSAILRPGHIDYSIRHSWIGSILKIILPQHRHSRLAEVLPNTKTLKQPQ
jgi:hypothetical protein